jgi:hypothetical protein
MKIELSMEQLQTIGSILENAPYKVAAPLLKHLQDEINLAQAAANTPRPADPPPKANGELHADGNP